MGRVTKVVISAHGDTNWRSHRLIKQLGVREGSDNEEVEYYGHMDNFGGVHATMKAYFSGNLPRDGVRIEITYGEETGMEGAREVAQTVKPTDVVIVIDVTATVTRNNICIEKCRHPQLREFVKEVLSKTDVTHEIYEDCPDPIIDQDETDVYCHATDYYFFLGLPVRGGDYNEGPVYCFEKDIDKLSEALVILTTEILQEFQVDNPILDWLDDVDTDSVTAAAELFS